MMLTGMTKPIVPRTTNEWTFNGQPFTSDQIGKAEGFVYRITNLKTGKKYIGRKYFWSIRKTKGKSRRVRKESDWKDYFGSSKEMALTLEQYGPENFTREILSIHKTRGDCNYSEIKTQFLMNVLEDDDYINDAIGKFRRRPPEHIKTARQHANSSPRQSL